MIYDSSIVHYPKCIFPIVASTGAATWHKHLSEIFSNCLETRDKGFLRSVIHGSDYPPKKQIHPKFFQHLKKEYLPLTDWLEISTGCLQWESPKPYLLRSLIDGELKAKSLSNL